MFIANIVPGQGFQEVQIHSKTTTTSKTGYVVNGGYTATNNKFFGIVAEASQSEKEEWKQNQHPITHTVVQYGAEVKAKATDYLIFSDGRKFYVQGIDNAGSLDVAMIYYVEERFDIK